VRVSLDGNRLSLDGAASTDPDGAIVDYDWYFGQPGAEQVFTGVKVSATVPAGKPLRVTLVLTDDDGATTYVTHNLAPIDVKPGSVGNPINPTSRGVTPVAILSADSFDATTVDSNSVRFGPARVQAACTARAEDVNGDGRLDLLLHVAPSGLGIKPGDTTLRLIGRLRDGTEFLGADRIRVVG